MKQRVTTSTTPMIFWMFYGINKNPFKTTTTWTLKQRNAYRSYGNPLKKAV
jgi:hypothetical protein